MLGFTFYYEPNREEKSMNSLIKKIICLTALIAMLTILVGCNNNSSDIEDMPEVVTIGFIGPLSGANASEGIAAQAAFEMYINQAVKEYNFPYQINVVAYDDQSRPEVGAEAAQKLVDDQTVLVTAGHWNSPVAEATIPIFKEATCPMIIWGAISDSLTSEFNYPYITRVVPTDSQENQPLAGYVLGDLGYNKIYVITPDTSYGKSNTEAFKIQMANYSAEMTGFLLTDNQTTDFTATLNQVRATGSDAIYYGGNAQECHIIAQQMQQMGLSDVLLFGISGIATEEFIENAGYVAAEGTIAIYPGASPESSEAYSEFLNDYNNYTDYPAGAFTVYAYQTAQIIIEALDNIQGVPTREKLTDAIANIEMEGVMGPTTFDAIGQTTNPMCYLVVCQDGKWIPYDSSEYATSLRSLPGRR